MYVYQSKVFQASPSSLRPSPYILLKAKVFRPAGLKEILNSRLNESNPNFGYEETIAILMVATGDLGFGPKC